MYKQFTVAVIFFFLLSGALCAETFDMKSKIISVKGEGKICIKPDIAYFPMDIATTDATLEKAYEKNELKIQNLITGLKKLGISDKQVEIKEPALYIGQSYAGDGEITTYGVSKVIIVTIKGIDKLKSSELISKVFNIVECPPRSGQNWASPGASQILSELSGTTRHGGSNQIPVVYDISNYDEVEEKAIEKALQNAKESAEKIAKALGVTIDEMLSFNFYEPYYVKGELFPGGPKSLNPEKMYIDASVNVSYSFIPKTK